MHARAHARVPEKNTKNNRKKHDHFTFILGHKIAFKKTLLFQ